MDTNKSRPTNLNYIKKNERRRTRLANLRKLFNQRRAKSIDAMPHGRSLSPQHPITGPSALTNHSRSISLPEGQATPPKSPETSPSSRTNQPLVEEFSRLKLNVVPCAKKPGNPALILDGTNSPDPVADQYYIPIDLSFILEKNGKKEVMDLDDNTRKMLTKNDYFSQFHNNRNSAELVEKNLPRFKTDLCRAGVDLTIIKRDEDNKELYSAKEDYSELSKNEAGIDHYQEEITTRFFDKVKTELPGMESILPLFCRLDFINPYYLALTNFTGVHLTHSENGETGYRQELIIFNTQQCTLKAISIYNEHSDNKGTKKRTANDSVITVEVDFNNMEDAGWVPESVRLKFTCGFPTSQWADNKKTRNTRSADSKKSLLPSKRSKPARENAEEISKKHIHPSKFLAILPTNKSPDKDTCIFRDQLCFTNLNPLNPKELKALQAKRMVTQFKNMLLQRMKAAEFAEESEETVKLPRGTEISIRLDKLEKHDPAGSNFENVFNDLLIQHEIITKEQAATIQKQNIDKPADSLQPSQSVEPNTEKTNPRKIEKLLQQVDQIREQCIKTWESIYTFTASAYCEHSFENDLMDEDKSKKDNLIAITTYRHDLYKIFLIYHKIQETNKNIREVVNELISLERKLKHDQKKAEEVHKDTDTILKIADFKRKVVNCIDVYRNQKSSISEQMQDTFNTVKSNLLFPINHDSTAGGKLCGILIRRTLHAVRHGFSDSAMKEISDIIENIYPGTRGEKSYKELEDLLHEEGKKTSLFV